MIDLKVPVAAIAASGIKSVLEAGDAGTVDDSADVQDGVLVWCSEVKVGGEASIVAQATLAQARSSLEHELPIGEHAGFGE
jgi:hypothetical protein